MTRRLQRARNRRDNESAGVPVAAAIASHDLGPSLKASAILNCAAALQQSAKRFCSGDDNHSMFLEEPKEPLLLRHKRLKPAEHLRLTLRPKSNPGLKIGCAFKSLNYTAR